MTYSALSHRQHTKFTNAEVPDVYVMVQFFLWFEFCFYFS